MLDSSQNDAMYDSESEYDDARSLKGPSHQESSEKALRELVAKEVRALQCWRTVVFICMAMAGAAVCRGVYTYLRNTETTDFENEFRANALQIIDSFNEKAAKKLEVLNPLATAYTSHALSKNLSFPFVTLPNFTLRASDVQVLGKDVQVRYMPIIYDDETRLKWEEEYALQHHMHLMDAYNLENELLEEQDAVYKKEETSGRALEEISVNCSASANCTSSQDALNQTSAGDSSATMATSAPTCTTNSTNNTLPFELENGYRTRIYNQHKPYPYESGPYFPLWQMSPITSDKLMTYLNDNFITTRIFGAVGGAILRNPQAVIGPFAVVTPDSAAVPRLTLNLMKSQFRYDLDEYIIQPASYLAMPVFDSFDEDNKTLVGVVISSVYWRVNLINILPPEAEGYICVMRNTFGQNITYRVDGRTNVTFLGDADLHNPAYDDLEVSSNIHEYIKERMGIRTSAYTSMPFNANFGAIQISIYPSRDTEDTYRESAPIVISSGVAVIFFVTLVAFLMYDRLIEYQQGLIMDRAIKSSAIVESLFPKQVQARLFEPMSSREGDYNWKVSHEEVDVINDTHSTGVDSEERKTTAIADLYPNTTILFADIAGFTAWSASRKPNEVFALLEALFRSFDKVAQRRGVFKVETIADSYLAATGVPEAQKDHAVRMARFAQTCLVKASQVFMAFEDLRGSVKNEPRLQIRIGMHSGPITAGILRGQKSRFQIFGDTVNTASRMGSTGLAGRIQISQSTADELIRAGHSDWIETREKKVFAKGKGYLTTYWMNPRSGKSTRTDELSTFDFHGLLSQELLEADSVNDSSHQRSIDTSWNSSDSYIEV